MFKNKQEAAVWAWMCDTARFKPHEFQTRFGLVRLERGQILVSQRALAEDFGLGRQQVRRLIDSMRIARMIDENSTHAASRAGTIVTILNYDKYQALTDSGMGETTHNNRDPQPITNPRPTQDQPTREIKGRKGKKEDKTSPASGDGEGCDKPASSNSRTSLVLVEPVGNEIEQAFGLWQSTRSEMRPTSRAVRLTDGRRRKLALRLAEIGPGEWRRAIECVRGSPLLRGDRTGWSAELDWLLKPENLAKVLEGNYDEPCRISNSPDVSSSSVDAMRVARSRLGYG